MKVKLASGNRITIPKEIIDKLNLKQGTFLDLTIDENTIHLSKIMSSKKELKSSNIPNLKNTFKSHIVSNLEESKNFSRRVVSECGLLVRTKRAYLNKACEECQGWLALQYKDKATSCKYNRTSEPVELKSKTKDLEIIEDKVIESVKYKHYKECTQCKEIFNKGFLINSKDFYCKSCAKKDFLNYMNLRKKGREI